MTDPIIIFWTCKDDDEARQIVNDLLEKRLIACASLTPKIESFYRWKGKIEHANECSVVIKTVHGHFAAIREYIIAHCSYEVPEILAIKIEEGHPDYLSWLQKQV